MFLSNRLVWTIRRLTPAIRRLLPAARRLLPFFLGKGNTWSSDILKLIFQAVAVANIADNAASSPLTSLYVALHTADPGAGGSQTTNESAYTSYVRVAVVRTSSGWAITSQTISPVANISFAACTGSTSTITHFSVGTASSGTGKILYSGTVTPNISVSTGVTPLLTVASTIQET